MAAEVGSILPANLHQVGYKRVFGAFFVLKGLKLEKFSKKCNHKTRIKQIGEPSLSLNVKPLTLFLKLSTCFSNIDKHLVRNYGKRE